MTQPGIFPGGLPPGPPARVPFVRAAGDGFAIGERHGAERAAALAGFIDDSLCRLNLLLDRPVSMQELKPLLDAHGEVIATAVPDLAAEIDGLAHGAGISREHALLLQLRSEIIGYRKVRALGGCTTYARNGAAPVLAQTIDLAGDLDDQIAVLDVTRTGSRQRSQDSSQDKSRALVLSFGGLLGYLGLNSHGLAVGLNLVLGGQWRPGVPPYLAIRHLLDTAASVAEAIEILHELPLASSRNIMLCDRERTASVELLGDERRVLDGPQLVHTNHFLDPDFAKRDELNRFSRRSSLRRFEACTAALDSLSRTASAEDHMNLLSTEPIRVAGNGDIRRMRTVAAVVLKPALGELHLRPGDPATGTTRVFTLQGATRKM
jgi:isopenicillin-N N-acyltransferase-like protein